MLAIHKKKGPEFTTQVLFDYINWAMKTTMMMIGMTKRRNEEGRARLGTVLVSMLFHRDGVPPLQEPF
ncbi:hypothetical protein SPCG_0686 [Streptococcus pneumoniae CGSP14]|nr:hypothetical protein SPCG_0686 [Streptococcus pneumoniae CGSP14]